MSYDNRGGQQVAVFQGPNDFGAFLRRLEPQMGLALPEHMKASRMSRLALTVFSTTPGLAECSQRSVAASILTACALGLEINIGGQGYLIPYKGTCTFVPGWKGLVDLANRSGRAAVWTGAVYRGDDFEYALGDAPFIRHRPGDEGDDNVANLTHVYACGRIKGSDVTIVEVWPVKKVERHLTRYNKVGAKHYALKDARVNFEMYARKVALLQVLKYMPQSIELTAAMEASNAAERGANVTIDARTWVTTEDPAASHHDDDGDDDGQAGAMATGGGKPPQDQGGGQAEGSGLPPMAADVFAITTDDWKPLVEKGERTVKQVLDTLQTRFSLSDDQRMEIASWAPRNTATGAAKQ